MEHRNRLLAALPSDEFARLSPYLGSTPLEQGKVLEAPGERALHIYFPWDGVCSLTTTMRDGRSVEVGTIGSEGLVGLSALYGAAFEALETVVQVPGAGATTLRVDRFMAELAAGGALRDAVQQYWQALLTLMTQSVACNALHDVQARCARWLLMTHDRVQGDTFSLTQEYLASMLGVRRPSVTVVARQLQDRGLIRYARGRVTVVDRTSLERAACECYAVVRAHFARLLPEQYASVPTDPAVRR
jgi:CRP-like cAMP-binding protein